MTAHGVAPITAIVLTYNEQVNLTACLASLENWVQHIVVVDSGSTDGTVEIARAHGAEVVHHDFENYSAQRNWALNNLPINTPWVLNIDADERVSEELRTSISRQIPRADPALAGFMVARRTVFLGRWIRHGGHYPNWHLRIFRVGTGRCEDRLYDQHFLVNGRVERLSGDLIDNFTPDLATFSKRHIRWAQLEAAQAARGRGEWEISGRLWSTDPMARRRWLRNFYGDRLPILIRPVLYFFYRYFFRLGFLDGKEGLVFHFLQGFWYRFLVDAMLFEVEKSVSAPALSRALRSEATGRPQATSV
jgi:glycosyltransferase involved in cell wall biosynthesis